jgi:alkaline phosphatase D
MVTPAVSSPSPFAGQADVGARERRTMERPHIHWVEFRSRGYLIVDVSAERARGEWWLLESVDRRGAPERMEAAFESARGANHLVKA